MPFEFFVLVIQRNSLFDFHIKAALYTVMAMNSETVNQLVWNINYGNLVSLKWN